MHNDLTHLKSARFSTLILLHLVLLVGCVAVTPDLTSLHINDLPMGESAVFIAVTDDIPANQLELRFNDQYNVFLIANSINKIYLPEDWYTFQLTRLPQDIDNTAMRYRLTAGEISRFVLLKQTNDEESGDQEARQTVTYSFAASSAFGFDYMQQQIPYPIVNLVPQVISSQ
jgi:hypothetical protein